MLAHSPHLPIVLDYIDETPSIPAEDEEGIILALQQRHRVRHIRLSMPDSDTRKLVPAIDGEFPMLESLSVGLSQENPYKTNLILHKTLQALRLRHLVLENINLSAVLPILTTSLSLVTLVLNEIYPAHSNPNDFLQHLSLLPQLEIFTMGFHDDASSTVIERQLLDAPVMTHVTFPHLRLFLFGGTNAYLEALLSHMTAPILETLAVHFFPQVIFSTANLLQFMGTTKNLKLTTVEFNFGDTAVSVNANPDEEAQMYAFTLQVAYEHFDEQVSSMVQILDGFGPVFSAVERLAFAYKKGRWPLGHDEVDPAQWRRLLRSFRNVKTLLVDHVFVEKLSDFLQSDDEEHLLELLPELKELSIPSGDYRAWDGFNRFIDARQVAGRPVTLVRR